jgi:hypothetical protein
MMPFSTPLMLMSVDQHIDPAKPLDRMLRQRIHLLELRDVGDQAIHGPTGGRNGVRCCQELGFINVGAHEMGTKR